MRGKVAKITRLSLGCTRISGETINLHLRLATMTRLTDWKLGGFCGFPTWRDNLALRYFTEFIIELRLHITLGFKGNPHSNT